MKEKVYLDSTIPSYLFDDRDEIKNFVEATKKWWQSEKDFYELWISDETIDELNSGDYPNKNQVLLSICIGPKKSSKN